jgi:hypothetical protein
LPYATVEATPVPVHYLKYDHSGLPQVHDFEVFIEEDHFLILFHRMHLRLGAMNRFVLYIHDFSVSPDPLLYNIFKKYAETAYIFVEVKDKHTVAPLAFGLPSLYISYVHTQGAVEIWIIIDVVNGSV